MIQQKMMSLLAPAILLFGCDQNPSRPQSMDLKKADEIQDMTYMPDMTQTVLLSRRCQQLFADIFINCFPTTNPGASDTFECLTNFTQFVDCNALCGDISCQIDLSPPKISGKYSETSGGAISYFINRPTGTTPPTSTIAGISKLAPKVPISAFVTGNRVTGDFSVFYAVRKTSPTSPCEDYEIGVLSGRSDPASGCPSIPPNAAFFRQAKQKHFILRNICNLTNDSLSKPIVGENPPVTEYRDWQRSSDTAYDPVCP